MLEKARLILTHQIITKVYLQQANTLLFSVLCYSTDYLPLYINHFSTKQFQVVISNA